MSRMPLCLVLFLCGCFRELGAVHKEPLPLPSLSLTVKDHSGGIWSAESCPRMPVLVLTFEQNAPHDAARHLFLLRAAPSEETLADLGSGKLSASSEALRVPITIEAHGRDLHVRSERALLPTAHYMLVWAEAHGARELPFVVSGSAAAGAQLVRSLPAALDARVPPNLKRALLHFDGYLLGDASSHVALRDAVDRPLPSAVEVLACSSFGLGPGDCISIAPDRELTPLSRYRIVVGEGLSDATRAPIAPLEIAFDTAPSRDLEPPQFLPLDCAKDEARHASLCLLSSESQLGVRARSDENGLLGLALAPDLHAGLAMAGEYALLAPLDAPARALLVLSDMAGNRTQLELDVAPVTDLAQVTIDELRVDPLGPEPSQEYVELLNFGDQPVSIMGFTLTDDPYSEGQRITDERELAPGERVLVVAPDFDVQDESDGPPASGARFARLAGALSLRNDGAALLLRDAQGRRLSASPALPPARPGQCIARHDSDSRSALGFVLDASGSCTPGFGSE